MKNITVEWTGSYPNLCSGEWLIRIDNKLIIDPNRQNYGSLLKSRMDTRKEYSTWSFGENWDENWDYYYSGKNFSDWCNSEKGIKLLELIKNQGFDLTKEEIIFLYDSINEKDWNNNSCGGCI